VERTLRANSPAEARVAPAYSDFGRFGDPDRQPNGGFPEPPPGAQVKIVRAHHELCDTETLVRLPGNLGPATVRRVVCGHCAEAFDAANVQVVAVLAAASEAAPDGRGRSRLPGWLHAPTGRGWRLLSVPLAAAAVVGGLLLVQGSDDAGQPPVASAPQTGGDAQAGAAGAGTGAAQAAGNTSDAQAELVRESNFSLALPQGWQQIPNKGGATFSASAAGGEAEATLWIERDPKLDFASFEARSLDQVRTLAGSARVIERTAGPTAEATVIRLAANPPAGSPAYEVTLRVAGPYRYYLATTVQPDASAQAVDGSKLVHSTFVPATRAQPTGGDEGK
jgi:hypothetical protein